MKTIPHYYKIFFGTITVALLASCNGFKTQSGDAQDSLLADSTSTCQIDSIVIEENTDTTIDVECRIEYLKGTGTTVDSINATIAQFVTGHTRSNNLEEALQNFTDSVYKDLQSEKQDFADDDPTVMYDYTITGHFIGRTHEIITYYMECWSYMGGAHGSQICTYLNFDTQNGHLLTPWDILDKKQKDKVIDLLLEQLCHDNNCKTKQQLMDKTGILDMGDLYITSNFRITDKGLTFHYGQYELACYAAGMQDISLTWDTLQQAGVLIEK